MSRVDQRNVTVVVGGSDLGTFDKKSGGLIDSEEQKYRPGNMGKAIALGGAVTTENITVSRLYDLSRDHSLVPALKAAVGKGAVTITEQPLDIDGNAFGQPIVFTGKLKSFQLPEHDSDSSDPALIELEVSTDAEVG